jgi:hypothetical protein
MQKKRLQRKPVCIRQKKKQIPSTPEGEIKPQKVEIDKKLLERQRLREIQYFEKLAKYRQKKEDQEALKKDRLEKLKGTLHFHAERDPERLFQPTKGLLRKLQSEEKHVQTGEIIKVQKRMIPEWRNEC